MDESLAELTPEKFDLLVGTSDDSKNFTKLTITNKSNEDAIKYYEITSKDPQASIPQSQKHLIASDSGEIRGISQTLHKQAIMNSKGTSDGKQIQHQHAAESFIVLSSSQVSTSSSNETPFAQSLESTESSSMGQEVNNLPKSEDLNRLSYRLKNVSRLFDVLSGKTKVNQPMCQECADLLQDSLNKNLADATRERDIYLELLKDRQKKEAQLSANMKENLVIEENEIANLKKEEEIAIEKLKSAEIEAAELEKELKTLEEEAIQLDKEEEAFWREYNQCQRELNDFKSERDSVKLKYEHDVKELERLQKTNVYNDTFCIGHESHFGTINGLRLGRMPNQPVEWSEINAAWGQTLLLLDTVAKRLNFTFKNYKLIPMGSFSKIERIDGDRAIYELYGSGDLHLGRLFQNRRFDHAMTAFLSCLSQIGDYAESQNPELRLPFRINKDRIGGESIRLQFSQEEHWTKACKYVLTNSKWLLAIL